MALHSIKLAILMLAMIAFMICQHVESIPLRSSSTRSSSSFTTDSNLIPDGSSNIDGSMDDNEFIKLNGNWLNIPNYSNFKVQVQSRADISLNMNIHGFIKRLNDAHHPFYQIYSKTSSYHSSVNATHYFDSQMEHYNSEHVSKFGKTSIDPLRSEYSNFRIPFHQLLNQAYENNAFLYNKGGDVSIYNTQSKYQIYDNVIDTICKDSELVVTFFHEQYFLLCLEKTQSRTISSLKHIVGREFIATVKSFTQSTFENSIDQFKLETHKFPKKKLHITASSTTDRNRNTLEMNANPRNAYFFQSDSHVCLLPWLKGSNCPSLSISGPLPSNLGRNTNEKLPQKRCIFIHGYGVDAQYAGSPVSSAKYFTYKAGLYWGKIDEYTPQCSERIFMREETNYRGWVNRELQQSICRVLTGNGNDNIVRNTIIFAHSMGNMMVGGAIANGYCSLDLTSTSWYNIMGPIQGTSVADTGSALCNPKLEILDKVVTLFGLCDKETGKPSEALFSLSTTCPDIEKLKSIAEKNVKGYMCGTSKLGVNPISPISIGLNMLGSIFLANYDNDGVVPFYSCKNSLPNSAFSTTDYKSMMYNVNANHLDGACVNGDGWFDSSSPCSYFMNKY